MIQTDTQILRDMNITEIAPHLYGLEIKEIQTFGSLISTFGFKAKVWN